MTQKPATPPDRKPDLATFDFENVADIMQDPEAFAQECANYAAKLGAQHRDVLLAIGIQPAAAEAAGDEIMREVSTEIERLVRGSIEREKQALLKGQVQ